MSTQGAAGGLCWSVDATPLGVELPAVEGATQTIAFVSAKGQIGASVRTVAIEQTIVAAGVFEQHQVLSQQSNRLDRANGHLGVQGRVEFVNEGDGLPVLAHELATRRAWADAGDAFVQFGFHARTPQGQSDAMVNRYHRRFIPALDTDL
jgi:hypothetical protein